MPVSFFAQLTHNVNIYIYTHTHIYVKCRQPGMVIYMGMWDINTDITYMHVSI